MRQTVAARGRPTTASVPGLSRLAPGRQNEAFTNDAEAEHVAGRNQKMASRRPGRRRLVVVDACEVGQLPGMLTLRVGRATEAPTCVAVPVTAAISLVQHLRSASADAEEDYWSVLPAIVKGAGSTDGDVVTAAVERWVLSQRWDKVLERVPGDGSGMFLVSHAGHVGLAVAPPFTAKRVLVIFDPTQLARLAAGFQSALAHAATAMTATLTPQLVTDTIVDLSARPWPPAGFADPTPQEATEDLLRRHRAFVARTPYVRPAENNLPASAIE